MHQRSEGRGSESGGAERACMLGGQATIGEPPCTLTLLHGGPRARCSLTLLHGCTTTTVFPVFADTHACNRPSDDL